MTRQDFTLIALTIKDAISALDPTDLEGLDKAALLKREGMYAVARALAHTLKLSNPRFDDRRFLLACLVPTAE